MHNKSTDKGNNSRGTTKARANAKAKETDSRANVITTEIFNILPKNVGAGYARA